MPTVRELVTKLQTEGNAAEKLAKFGLAVNGVKAALDLMVGAFKLAKSAVFDFTADLAKTGDEFAKAARNIGVTAEEIQELKFAAEISGASMKDVQTAIQRMGKGLNDTIRNGTGPFADSLAQMGLKIEEFDGLNPVERFELLATSLADVADGSERAALAQDLFGRGGKTLLPLLNASGEGIRALRQEAQDLGLQFSNESAVSAENFVDAQLRLQTVLNNIKGVIAEELMPIISGLIDRTREWLRENRDLIKGKILEFVRRMIEFVENLRPALDAIVNVVKRLIPLFEAWAQKTGGIISQDFESFLANMLALFRELQPTLEVIVEVLKFFGIIIFKLIHDLIELAKILGGLTFVLEVVTARLIALKLASWALLGPFGAIAAAFVTLLPFALKLGDSLGDIVFGMSDLGREQEAIIKRSRGVAKFRGAQFEVLEGLTKDSRGGLTTVLDAIRGEGGEEILRNLERQVTSVEGKKVLANERKRLELEKKFRKEQRRTTGLEEERIENKRRDKRRRQQIADRTELAKQRAIDEKKARRLRLGLDKPKDEDKGLTDAELLVLIQKAGATGQSLTGLIGGRKLATTGPPPVITVTVTNFNITQQVEAPVTVNGVPGEEAEDLAEMVEDTQRRIFSEEIRAAMEEIQPVEAR